MCVIEVVALGGFALFLRFLSNKFKWTKLHFCSTCKEGKHCEKHSYIKFKQCNKWV